MHISDLIAIDTHVHLEPEDDNLASDRAAKKYFGDSGAERDWKSLAEYYRSRKIGCVVFPVDESLTGRPQVPNDESRHSPRKIPISCSPSPASTRHAAPKRCAKRGG